MYMAAGADDGDVNGITGAGYARLYARLGMDWNMIQQINGTRSYGYFGYSQWVDAHYQRAVWTCVHL